MNKLIVSGILASLALAALVVPARGDGTKPISPTESPIHMTYLPVPNEFHTGPEQAVSAPALLAVAYDGHTPAKAPEMPVSVHSGRILAGGERDDSDARLESEGRRR